MVRPLARDLVTAPVLLAAGVVALIALAGAAFGPAAATLALPAALVAGRLRRVAQERRRSLEQLSKLDPLTGLGNRRLMEERLAYEIARHGRHERRFSLLALDLDGFKAVNDRFGHQAGDEILREVAQAIASAVREQDTVVRVGGDEFLVLAPEATGGEADRLARRIRRAVAGAVGGLETLSASVGWAVFPEAGEHPDELVAAADAAALEAKRRRRLRREQLRSAA